MMALDLGKATRQLQSAIGDVAMTLRNRRQRFADAVDIARIISPAEARERTDATGERPFVAAQTHEEGLLASIPPPALPDDWSAVSVDGSHIDVDRHLPLSCYLVNLGGCVITYGSQPGCTLFSEPALAVREGELYLRESGRHQAETAITGPLLGALRTVREVEKLAETAESLQPRLPTLAVLDGTLAFWDLQHGSYPRNVVRSFIESRLSPALEKLRELARWPGGVTLAAYTSKPRTTEVVGAVRASLCGTTATECTQRCSTRRSDLPNCDRAAGFDDRELFELVLEPGHRSPLYTSGRRSRAGELGNQWTHFYYVNVGFEIARVEVPPWVADDPSLLGMGHAMLVRQGELGLGYPVVISEAHEQAVVTGHDRSEFQKVVLSMLERQGLPAPESGKSRSKRLPAV